MPDPDLSRYPIGTSLTLDDLDAGIHETAARLRPTEPISWIPELGGWFVTGHGLADRIMRDSMTFTVDDPRFSTGRVLGESMLSTDGENQARHRSAFDQPFRRSTVEADYSTMSQRIAYRLVSDLAPAGSCDLRSDLALPLAVQVITEVLGMAHVKPGTVAEWYRSFVEAVNEVSAGRLIPDAGGDAHRELRSAVDQTIRLSSASVLTQVSWQGSLTSAEISSNVGVIMFGAIETSEAMTSSALWHLLRDPTLHEQVRAKRDLVAPLIEESLRLEPAASVVDRYATTSMRLGNAHIREGDFVQISISGANRDPAVFKDPDLLDVQRSNSSRHLSFAKGPHACLGLHLARLETTSAINAVLDLLPGVELVPINGTSTEPPTGRIFRKPPALAVRWRR